MSPRGLSLTAASFLPAGADGRLPCVQRALDVRRWPAAVLACTPLSPGTPRALIERCTVLLIIQMLYSAWEEILGLRYGHVLNNVFVE